MTQIHTDGASAKGRAYIFKHVWINVYYVKMEIHLSSLLPPNRSFQHEFEIFVKDTLLQSRECHFFLHATPQPHGTHRHTLAYVCIGENLFAVEWICMLSRCHFMHWHRETCHHSAVSACTPMSTHVGYKHFQHFARIYVLWWRWKWIDRESVSMR